MGGALPVSVVSRVNTAVNQRLKPTRFASSFFDRPILRVADRDTHGLTVNLALEDVCTRTVPRYAQTEA